MLQKIILHKATYIDDRALRGLLHAKDTLTHLQISECAQVTDAGIKELKDLQKLHTLILYKLASVDNNEDCKQFLKSHIPKCNIMGK